MKQKLLTFWRALNIKNSYLVTLIIGIVLALVAGAGIMLALGYSPIMGYGVMLSEALGSQRAIGNTLAKSATLCLTGLATAVATQAGMFNFGGEGQLYLGAMASALLGSALTGVPALIAVPLCLLAAMVAGGIWALIPAWLKVRLNINEVITTIMLNSVAIYFCSFLSNGPFKTAERGIASGTAKIDESFAFTQIIDLSNLTTSIILSIVIALLVWYLMKRTTLGYEMKLTGENERFAYYSGISTAKLLITAMVISGAICGLVGMFEVFGIHKRFIDAVSNDFFFDGMLLAMAMRYQPTGIILMSFFFGVLKIGGTGMDQIGIPSQVIVIVQLIIIFFMAAHRGLSESNWMHRIFDNLRHQVDKIGGNTHE